MTTHERKSAVVVEFPPVAPGCAPTVRLTVTTPRKTLDAKVVDACQYALSEIPAFPGERAFQLDRLDFERGESWHVRLTRNGLECDCMGWLGRNYCKHTRAISELLKQEKYREPAADAQTA